MTAPDAQADGEWMLVPREPTEAMLDAGTHVRIFANGALDVPMDLDEAKAAWSAMLAASPTAPKAAPETGEVERIAIDQNDAMRQELSHVGNLISALAITMRVELADADGQWPDLAGRIGKLHAAALASPPAPSLSVEAMREAILEEAAQYLDGYAGGHYMAQLCAAALRALATKGEK